MFTEHARGPFCQSCGMPLQKAADFGTAVDGFRVNDYCSFCFQDGAFTAPDITAEAMIDKCAGLMAQRGIMPDAQARAMMAEIVPRLRRWQCPHEKPGGGAR